MKQVAIVGERKAELIDVPDPRPKENWALVKVYAAPMCTEYKTFVAGHRAEYLGHEAAGEVVEMAQPGRVQVGDRVVVMPQYPCGKCPLCLAGEYIHCEHNVDFAAFTGGRQGSATMAQYLLKPDWLLMPIPDGVSYEQAALACCGLGPSFGAFEAMKVTGFDTVLITGAGPVGLGGVINACYRGARVLVVEPVPWRQERARQLGAEEVLSPNDPDLLARIREVTGGVGVDCALDCTGAVEAQRLCIDATRRKGRVAFVGEGAQDLPIRVGPDMLRKGLALIGAWHYNLAHYPRVMQVIQRSPVVGGLISHVLPMSAIQQAFEISASHQCAKVILKPWQ